LLAAVLALFGTALSYLVLGAVLGVAAAWSRDVVLDQAFGLGLHAGVVFLRGGLPAVLAAGSACLLWRHWRGSDPGAGATLGLSLVLASGVTLLLLTSSIGDWPRLHVKRAADAVATVLLLGAVAGGSDLLARRWLRRPERR
jgi:hypothetical protein